MKTLARRTVVGTLARIGRTGETVARHAGEMTLLTWHVAVATVTGRVAFRDVIAQLYSIGVGSIPLVAVTSILSGVVTSQQGGYQFTSSIPLYVLGSVVTSSVVLELGPVMTTFVLIGRVGARITAELGTMKVSEQIDALHSLGRDPVCVLAAPRIIAGTVATPLLVGLANAIGVFAIPLISVHMGFGTRGGAEGVGRATTAAVVFMIITVLVLDATFPPLFLN
jgi:phospholipid/cholesterol/gamma-HCH transport system permease protein